MLHMLRYGPRYLIVVAFFLAIVTKEVLAQVPPSTLETLKGTWLQCSWIEDISNMMDSPQFHYSEKKEERSATYKFVITLPNILTYDQEKQTLDLGAPIVVNDDTIGFPEHDKALGDSYVIVTEGTTLIDRRTLHLAGVRTYDSTAVIDGVKMHQLITTSKDGECKIVDPRPVRKALF